MRHARSFACVTVVIALVAVACSDQGRDGRGLTAPNKAGGPLASVVMGACTTIGDLNALAAQVFGSGSPNVNSVLGKLDNLRKKVEDGDVAGAQAQANNIVTFVRDKAAQGTLPGTQAQVTQFISGVLCFAGLSPDTFLILPSDAPQVRIAADGNSGVSLQGSTVGVPTLLTLSPVDLSGGSPLITKLDQYPSYVSITSSSALTKPAVVAVCPTGLIDASVRARLRLGHQAAGGFAITPNADGSFLPCSVSSAQLKMPGWLRNVASIFLPKPLYARVTTRRESGGVGGSATEFSPFGAVDATLEFSSGGGVGGSSTEFIRVPNDSTPAPGRPARRREVLRLQEGVTATPRGLALSVEACSDTVDSERGVGCRPDVTVTTHLGTPLAGVPVSWQVVSGGGGISAEMPVTAVCGGYGTSVSTSTDAQGRATVCWKLGAEAGENVVSARPSAGGEAPAGVSFTVPTGLLFSINSVRHSATISLSDLNYVYNGAAKSATAATTPAGLNVVSITYDGGSEAPMNAGTYAVVATLTNASYAAVPATGSLVIAKAAQSALTVTGAGTGVYGQTVALGTSGGTTGGTVTWTFTGSSACTVNASGTVSITAGTGTCAVVAIMAGNGNYEPVSSVAFEITVSRALGSITIAGPTALTYGAEATLTATVTGDGAVTYAVVSGPCTVVGASVTMTSGTGTCSVQGTLGVGPNYFGATSNILPITATKAEAGIALSGLAQTFTGTPRIVGATTTPADLATVALTYDGSFTPPVGAGTYAISGFLTNPNYFGSSSGSLVVAKAPSTTQITCPATTTYTGAAVTPCSASATGIGGLSQAVPVTYTSNVVGAATASASYAGGVNWLPSSASAAFSIRYVQSGCFASPVYSTMPNTKSYQRKGSNLPIKCTLLTASGAGVLNASGNLTIEDKGTNPDPSGTGPNVSPTLTFVNAFRVSGSGNYAYGFDTSPLTSLHFYVVTALWNDGSKTTGWFYVR